MVIDSLDDQGIPESQRSLTNTEHPNSGKNQVKEAKSARTMLFGYGGSISHISPIWRYVVATLTG